LKDLLDLILKEDPASTAPMVMTRPASLNTTAVFESDPDNYWGAGEYGMMMKTTVKIFCLLFLLVRGQRTSGFQTTGKLYHYKRSRRKAKKFKVTFLSELN
jgi:hypothetical protein